MLPLEEYLQTKNITDLHREFSVVFQKHALLPLTVVNYHQIKSPKKNPICASCRGTVIEDSHPPQIIAKGFDRFFHIGEENNLSESAGKLTLQSKEDGTYMLLFCYNNMWLTCTRHNFADDVLPCGLSYSALLERTLGCTLDQIGAMLDKDVTYCLELCTPENRIVRIYDSPKVYLLAAVQRGSWLEKDAIYLDQCCVTLQERSVNIHRPEIRIIENFDAARTLLVEKVKLDPTYEGFVLVDESGRRMKLKSPKYFTIHILKYRGWVRATPSLLVPIILANESAELLAALKVYKTEKDWKNFKDIHDSYVEKLNNEISDLREIWKVGKTSSLDRSNFGKFLSSQKSPCRFLLWKMWDQWEKNMEESENQQMDMLSQIWQASADHIIKKLFENKDSTPHAKGYCKLILEEYEVTDTGVAKHKPQFDANTKNWMVQCYCGKDMNLVRLKTDHILHRRCHCGELIPKKQIYRVGTLIWQCVDPACGLTHECHAKGEKSGSPLGLPASEECKNLRLLVHDLINEVMTKLQWDKGAVYSYMSRAADIPGEQMHMALCNIDLCLKIIMILQDKLDE